MKEPVDHILRPRLPWRMEEDAITECGYDAAKVKYLTRAEFDQRHKELGRTRTAMLTCMTCMDANARYAHWGDDPRQAMLREIEWEVRWGREIRDREQRLKDELIAIAGLIEAHRDEFDAAVKERKDRQAWIDQKTAREKQLKQKPPPDGWV
jgi:hypothetical protein